MRWMEKYSSWESWSEKIFRSFRFFIYVKLAARWDLEGDVEASAKLVAKEDEVYTPKKRKPSFSRQL